MRILITGSSGFIGSEILRVILEEQPEATPVVALRAARGQSAAARLEQLGRYWQKFTPLSDPSLIDRVELVEWDLEEPGLPPDIEPVDYIYHAAASTDLSLPLGASRRANLFGTQKVLQVARRSGVRLKRFVHLSTAYTAGQQRGLIRIDSPRGPFRNGYEQSKHEAEQCVRDSGLPYTILRPSIVVGRASDGYVMGMKVLYSVWRVWLSGYIPRAPLDRRSKVDIVPVDYVVAATRRLAESSVGLNQTYHLCSGPRQVSPLEIMDVAVREFSVKRPPVSPVWAAHVLNSRLIKPFISHGLRQILERMIDHLPYLGQRRAQFDMEQSDAVLADLGVECPRFEAYGTHMFRYCFETKWGKRARSQVKGASLV